MTSSEATTAQINQQLEAMVGKLRQKVQSEVQQRIENQRKNNLYLQQVGSEVTERLVLMFDRQIQALGADIDAFESGLAQWEVGMQQGMGANNRRILEFESEVNSSLHGMSASLNDKFKITQQYDRKVVERMDMLRDSFNSKDLSRSENSVGYTVAQLEHDRH